MGKLFDEFNGLTFNNEAEVSQNFITPLLENYLGYDLKEIIPEKFYPAKDIFSGVNFSKEGSKGLKHRPDFVICLDGDTGRPKFVIDSKAPDEDIDEHLGQLRSYATSVGQNFLMMSNGTEIKVYDVNNLIFYSNGMDDLQYKIDHLITLLGRENHRIKSPIDIIKELDYEQATTQADSEKVDQEINKKRILLADFTVYFENIRKNFTSWHLPSNNFQAINNLDIKKIDPGYLLSFKHHHVQESGSKEETFKFAQIENDFSFRKRIFVGETGTGKTSLLKYLTYRAAENCLVLEAVKIPVFISLREISHNYNLETLIIFFLNRHGYNCKSFFDLPANNDFVFFLDAYDEVSETFQKEVLQSIENLGIKYEWFLTTRPNSVPTFQGSLTLDILPLSEIQVEKISRQYIDSGYYQFQRQIENNNLKSEYRNTLLLLFLLSLFKETGAMPDTSSKIINAIVERTKLWQNRKEAGDKNIKWEVLVNFLSMIGFRIFESDEVFITMADAEAIILKTLLELESKRKISPGLTIDQIITALTNTGLLIAGSSGLYFWHRLFLNHFASSGLKERYQENPKNLDAIADNEKWDIIIIGLSSQIPDITGIIRTLKDRLWLAAYCLLENSSCEDQDRMLVVDKLIKSADSPVQHIRKKAFSYLDRIDTWQTRNFFTSIFSGEHYSDVTMMALPAIGKTGTDEAKEIIYRYLDWDEGSFLTGESSHASVAKALSFFDEPEHLQIIQNWKKVNSYQMNEECRKIFIGLYSKKRLSTKLVTELQRLYIWEYLSDEGNGYKLDELGKILALVPNEKFAVKLIGLPFQNDEYSNLSSLEFILKHYESLPIVTLIKDKIFEKSDDHFVIEKFAAAIRDSACVVPKEIFFELIDHPHVNVASAALSGLKRFEFSEVEKTVKKHLYGDQPQLQSWALEVMIENAEIIKLFRNGKFPSPFYGSTAHTVLKAVRKFHLTEAMPLMYKIYLALSKNKRYEQESHLAFDLAATYFFMGETRIQAKIVRWFFDGKVFLQKETHYHNNLMKKLKFLDPTLAISVANGFYKMYFPPPADKHHYPTTVFIEVAEDLNEESTKDGVKRIAEYMIQKLRSKNSRARHEIEHPLRALAKIGNLSDEDWIIKHFEDLNYDSGFECTQLRRAIECLANFGSAKSLPLIRKVAQQRKLQETVVNICQLAYNNICRRGNIRPLDDFLLG